MRTRAAVLTGIFLAATVFLCRLSRQCKRLIDFSLRGANNSLLLPGRLHVPTERPTRPFRARLILFLHGAGESGSEQSQPD